MSSNPGPLPRPPAGGAPDVARNSGDPADAAEAPAPAGRRYRVFLVEDHPIVREGLTQLVNEEKDLVTCGAAGDAGTALREIERTAADVAVVDLLLGDDDGLELVRTLKAKFPHLPTLVLSMYKESL